MLRKVLLHLHQRNRERYPAERLGYCAGMTSLSRNALGILGVGLEMHDMSSTKLYRRNKSACCAWRPVRLIEIRGNQ